MARIVRESVHDHDRRWKTRYDKIVRCILGRCGTCAQEAAFGVAFISALDVCGSPGRPKLLHGYDPGITERCPPHETLALRMIHIQAIPDMHDRSGKNSTCLHHVARSIDDVFDGHRGDDVRRSWSVCPPSRGESILNVIAARQRQGFLPITVRSARLPPSAGH